MAKRKRSVKRGRQPGSLAGTNLSVDPRTGYYIWRRQANGRRLTRSTGTRNLEIALRAASKFEDDFDKQQAGLKVYDAWKQPLAPLIDEWIAEVRQRSASVTYPRDLEMRTRRVVDLLRLRILADLDDIMSLDRRLKKAKQRADVIVYLKSLSE